MQKFCYINFTFMSSLRTTLVLSCFSSKLFMQIWLGEPLQAAVCNTSSAPPERSSTKEQEPLSFRAAPPNDTTWLVELPMHIPVGVKQVQSLVIHRRVNIMHFPSTLWYISEWNTVLEKDLIEDTRDIRGPGAEGRKQMSKWKQNQKSQENFGQFLIQVNVQDTEDI